MKKTKREWDILSKEEREVAIRDIIAFFLDERDETMDIIGANEILDLFLQDIAPKIYNKALDDAKSVIKRQTEEIDFELSTIKK